MKKQLLLIAVLSIAGNIAAQELPLNMPFRKGIKDAIAGWVIDGGENAKAELLEENETKMIALAPRTRIYTKSTFAGKAGDTVTIEFKARGVADGVRVGTINYGPKGYSCDSGNYVKLKPEMAAYKTQIVLADSTLNDRTTDNFRVSLSAGSAAKDIVIEEVKAVHSPKE